MLLRGTLGAIVAVEASGAVASTHTDVLHAVPAVTLVISGIALTAGLFTPVCSALVAAGYLLLLVTPSVRAVLPYLDGAGALIALAAALALGLLGPGTYSIDAYLFGRREIFIPASRVGIDPITRGDEDVPCPGDSRKER